MKTVYLVKDLNNVVVYVGIASTAHFSPTHSFRSIIALKEADKSTLHVEVVGEMLDKTIANTLYKEQYKTYKDTILNKRIRSETKEIPLEYIKEYIKYDPNSPTGLTWIKRPYKSNRIVGSSAGSILKKSANGGKDYWQLSVKDYVYKCHRVIWALVHGSCDSSLVIDHIDGNGLNNKIENLRLVPHTNNCTNKITKINELLKLPKIQDLGNVFLCRFSYRGKNFKFRVRKEDYENEDLAKQALIARVSKHKKDNLEAELKIDKVSVDYSEDFKLNIYNTYLSGKTITETARDFNVGTSTVKRIVDLYNKINNGDK